MQKVVNQTELQAVSKKFLEELRELENSSKWEHVDDKPVKISRMEKSERVVARAEVLVKLPFDVLAKYFQDPLFMKKLTDRVSSAEVLFKGAALHVVQIRMKGFAMISDRELVVVFTFHRDGNKIYLGNRSCEFPCKIEKDAVRAFAHCGGYILERIDENATKITNIADIDMNGSIPDFVKNKVAVMRATALSEIEEKVKASLK